MTILILLSLLFQDSRPEIRIPDLEQQIHQAANINRQMNDREPLQWNDVLARAARMHSEDMARRDYFKHVNPEGLTPMKRLQAAGYDECRLVGENIHQNNLYSRVITEKRRTTYDWNTMEDISSTTMKAWMESEGHRKNILDPEYTSEGIGVAIAPDDKVYVTQVFCAVR